MIGSSQPPNESLRQRFVRRLSEDPTVSGTWLQQITTVLSQCQNLEASEAFSFFWEAPPEHSAFSLRDFPNASYIPPTGLQPGRTLHNAIFLEGQIPTAKLAAGVLSDVSAPAGDNFALTELAAAVETAGQKTAMLMQGPPDLLLMEDAMVGRLGALVVADDGPFSADGVGLYEQMGIPNAGALLQVLNVFLFVEFDGRFGQRLLPPQMIFFIPIGPDGRVIPVGSGDRLPIQPQVRRPFAATMADPLAESQRPSILTALFGLSCLNARRGVSMVSGSSPKEPGLRMDITGLRDCLAGSGAAGEHGIARAMTVCRDEFLTPPTT